MENLLNLFDIIILGCLLLSIAVGLIRGFTREFLGIMAWVGSIVIAILTMPFFKSFAATYIKDDFLAAIVAGLVIFVIAFMFLGTLSRHVSLKVKSSILGGLDRTFGLVFGAARGVLLILVLFVVASLVSSPEKWPDMVKESKSIPYVEKGGIFLQDITPQNFYDAIGGKKKLKPHFASKELSAEQLVKDLSRPQPGTDKTEKKK